MEKILEYVYYGTVMVEPPELKFFLHVARDLYILRDMPDREIKDLVKRAKSSGKATEVVYYERGRLFANEFKRMRNEGEMIDVLIEVDGQHIEAHRLVLSAASPYFKLGCDHMTTIEPAIGTS